ncbi:uncharacterized protein LOC128189792 [Crassostrea angulata]|uniref:uncharacterized protein LOC128189792 n=1 Tax=Magallana angulata TaxID=2784310 RepID=UPI0022B1BC6F|nr:uncharacterized protein LOC128189792 [Crassostrea angulata]
MRTGLSFLLLWSIRLIGSNAKLILSTPSYVSEWKSMTANSTTSRLVLQHKLREDPAYVKVDARTDTGFIFPAFGSAQQDDDANVIYGGVVFFYNRTHIDIFVSHWCNSKKSRKNLAAVYTGADSQWIGPQNIIRVYESITVQAKAWRSRDLPPPTWKSQTIDVKEGGCLNASLIHTLNRYPDLILVQIRKNRRIFHGQGLSSLGSVTEKLLHFGGVLFGTNKSHVQLWSACDTTGNLSGSSLIAIADGWGEKANFLNIKYGSITVTAWDLTGLKKNEIVIRKRLQEVETANYLLTENLATGNFINVQLHVLDGANKNFRFDGVGSVMNEAEPYGGLVYGYNDSVVAMWVPQPHKRESNESAAVFMLGRIWGWNFKAQMTNNVDIVLTVMAMLVPICLLEVNTSTTHIDSSFQYENYNNSVLKFAYGDEITLTCKLGYKPLDPTVKMTCNPEHNGTWSRTLTFICREIVCPDPFIMNTDMLHNDTSYGGLVSYTCAAGYKHVSGDLRRTCVGNGSWNGTEPRCKECKCPCSAIGSAPIKSNDTEKLKQRIKELRSMLLIQKNMTAKARLLKICASDPRPSAKGIGVVLGIGVLVVIISSIVLLDLPNLINAVKSKKQ